RQPSCAGPPSTGRARPPTCTPSKTGMRWPTTSTAWPSSCWTRATRPAHPVRPAALWRRVRVAGVDLVDLLQQFRRQAHIDAVDVFFQLVERGGADQVAGHRGL